MNDWNFLEKGINILFTNAGGLLLFLYVVPTTLSSEPGTTVYSRRIQAPSEEKMKEQGIKEERHGTRGGRAMTYLKTEVYQEIKRLAPIGRTGRRSSLVVLGIYTTTVNENRGERRRRAEQIEKFENSSKNTWKRSENLWIQAPAPTAPFIPMNILTTPPHAKPSSAIADITTWLAAPVVEPLEESSNSYGPRDWGIDRIWTGTLTGRNDACPVRTMSAIANLLHKGHFPAFASCPVEDDTHSGFYETLGPYIDPTRHWVTFLEVAANPVSTTYLWRE
ncbi:hypothetical protein MMC30_001646 [Trapelia coarctata]|nr:hypothetical protein [Trapelia coarctata]